MEQSKIVDTLETYHTTAPTNSRSCCYPHETSSAATETSVANLTHCIGASPAPASPLPPMVHFGGILIHSRVQTSVTTMDWGCGRLLWPAARARN